MIRSPCHLFLLHSCSILPDSNSDFLKNLHFALAKTCGLSVSGLGWLWQWKDVASEVRPESGESKRSAIHVTESSGCALSTCQYPVVSKNLSHTWNWEFISNDKTRDQPSPHALLYTSPSLPSAGEYLLCK